MRRRWTGLTGLILGCITVVAMRLFVFCVVTAVVFVLVLSRTLQ